MKLRSTHYPATTALLVAALMASSAGAIAQVGHYNSKAEAKKASQREERKPDEPVAEERFPAATRKSPHLQATKNGGKTLTEIIGLIQAKNYPEAIAKADGLLATTDNIYERSYASQLAAAAAAQAGDDAKAVGYFKQAIDANGLDNNDHYVAMHNLVATQYRSKQYADALASIDRLLTETGSDAPEYIALKGTVLADMGRQAEAAALYEKLYMRDPADKKSLMNAVALYQQAKNFKKADALLTQAQGKGELNDPAAYRALYVGFINAGKLHEAISTIDEGLAKGVVQPSPDLVNVYAVIAQTAYGNDDSQLAVDMYGRAAEISSDGEQRLNQARVLLNEGRIPEAKHAAQQALDKGLKNPADAKRILAAGGK
jgi:tetratricopeptide (TPR) repeat protein